MNSQIASNDITSKTVIVVVGDKFEGFAANPGVVTATQARQLMQDSDMLPSGMVLVPGQGLCDEDIDSLMEDAERTGATRRIDVRLRKLRPQLASASQSHKRLTENTIISTARRTLEENTFELDLLVDERCELMGDHQTGQHIQGMILIEAARQAFLAVTEQFFIDHKSGRRYYFVINAMNTEYLGFVFPIPATLRYTILEQKITNPSRLGFRAYVDVIQAGQVCARTEVRFTAFEAEKIVAKENERAEGALRWYAESFRTDAAESAGRLAA